MATQSAEFRRFQADRRIAAEGIEDEAERALRRIERDVEFITAVRDATGEVREMLAGALRRVERAMAGEAPS